MVARRANSSLVQVRAGQVEDDETLENAGTELLLLDRWRGVATLLVTSAGLFAAAEEDASALLLVGGGDGEGV